MPREFMKALFLTVRVLSLILSLELLVYSLIIVPGIKVWGATEAEQIMMMAGDSDQRVIMSTRAINISAPKELVWRWLMQLGADRGGFFSYSQVEQALGYQTSYPDLTEPKFSDFVRGDTVRGSNDESLSVIPYNFDVLYIAPESTFVLDNWGTFLLARVDENRTRLVIRTQEPKSTTLVGLFKQHLALPFHFIMERRLLYGIKIQAEGVNELGFSQKRDLFWMGGLIVSWGLIFILMLLLNRVMMRILVPSVLGVLWLSVVFLMPPLPLYSLALSAILGLVFITHVSWNKKQAVRPSPQISQYKMLGKVDNMDDGV